MILVHGIGEQRPNDFLKDFVTSLVQSLERAGHPIEFSPPQGLPTPALALPVVPADPEEIEYAHRPETGDLGYSYIPRTTQIRMRNPTGGADKPVNFYEVYWADLGEPGSESILKTVSQAWWAARTSLRSLARALVLPAGTRLGDRVFVGMLGLAVFLFGVVLHLADLLTVAGRLYGRWAGIARGVQRTLLGYVGDVKVYTDEAEQFKRDWIIWRFREILNQASRENDRVIIVGHSLGSVVAYNGLTLEAHVATPAIDKVEALFTLGSPLAKIAYVWPERIRLLPEPLPPPLASSANATIRWYNFYDVMDPIGANLKYYERSGFPPGGTKWRWPDHLDAANDRLAQRFKSPDPGETLGNFAIIRGWLPVGAHMGYWKDETVLRCVMGEILSVPTVPPPPSRVVLRLFLRIALLPVSVLLVLFLFRWWFPSQWAHVIGIGEALVKW